MTGNSDPRVRIVFVYRFNSDFHSFFTLQVTGCDFPHGSNFGVPANPTFSGQLIFHLLVKKTLDMSLALQSVRTRQCALSRTIVRLQLFSESCKSTHFNQSIWLEAFPLVACTSAINFLVQESQSKVYVSLSRSLLARTMGQIALPTRVSPYWFDK